MKSKRVLSMIEMEHAKDCFDLFYDHGIEVVHQKPDKSTLLESIGTYDAYLASLKIRFDREVIENAGRCKAVFTVSTGTDHIDINEACKNGIIVISMKDDICFLRTIKSTAEIAWALLLGVSRRIPWGFDSVKEGNWLRDAFIGHSLQGKTLGILGYGRLGEMVAKYAIAFDMKVIACDIKRITDPAITQVDYEHLLKHSDVLSVHLHLNEETRHIIGWDSFMKMKDGIVLINTSRGAVINEAAFLAALENGKIAAAGIDVIDGEWRNDLNNHPLIRYASTHDNLLITPHIGGITYEAQRSALKHTLIKVIDYFK